MSEAQCLERLPYSPVTLGFNLPDTMKTKQTSPAGWGQASPTRKRREARECQFAAASRLREPDSLNTGNSEKPLQAAACALTLCQRVC